uniref:undecaprenyl-diphosphate phosphatase n=1 Tax=uncultured Maritalea sp. TaxID=757249 RepID=UPI0026279AC0
LSGLNDQLRSVAVIGWSTVIFGVALYIGDRFGGQAKTADDWTLKDAIAMGLAQIIALIPGASRSGVTMTMARGLGYKRVDAARLSMLMSIPTIMASGILLGAEAALDANIAALRDCAIAAAFGMFGLMLKRLNLPIVPIILGMVLGGIMEVKFRTSMARVENIFEFIERPVAQVLFGIIVIVLVAHIYSLFRAKKSEDV